MYRILSLLAVSLAVLPGCYSYSYLPADQISPGKIVRARLTAAEAEKHQTVLRQNDRVFQGTIISETPEAFLLQVPVATGQSGERLNQRITVPMSQLLEIEVRNLDRLKTVGVVAAATIAAGFLVASQFGDGDPTPTPSPPKGGGNQARLVFTWSW